MKLGACELESLLPTTADRGTLTSIEKPARIDAFQPLGSLATKTASGGITILARRGIHQALAPAFAPINYIYCLRNPVANTYDEYGIPGSANIGRFQYTGQAWMSELGMYYYKARMYSPTLGRFMQTDPIGYKDQINLYAYAADDPVDHQDPTGQDAVMVINPDGTRTLVIPVSYTGSGASPTDIAKVANSVTVAGSTDILKVVPTSTPIQGVINHMDVSPGYDYKTYPNAGEGQKAGPGPEGTGGNEAHINSSNGQVNQAAAHDTLHFAGLTDKYVEGPKDAAGNRTSAPSPGYDNSNIMTSRSGTTINQSQFNEALKNPTTKVCDVSEKTSCN